VWQSIAAIGMSYEIGLMVSAQRVGIQLPRALHKTTSKYERSRARSGQLQCRVGQGHGYMAFSCAIFAVSVALRVSFRAVIQFLSTAGTCITLSLVRTRYGHTKHIGAPLVSARFGGMWGTD
jgi:hypothetical protein